eukprot:TRINITY_DN390_c0_g1_i2.p1 TRINITY_DN390_c0_g1~~TRINITY_DN390_c0_g1_i2.p1  ORF type:complete len:592 (-),score=264.11 TRINITY_DN390_c0_g1_i2:85-1839(-)
MENFTDDLDDFDLEDDIYQDSDDESENNEEENDDKNEEENGKNEEENEIEVDDGENDGENNGENEEVDGENEEEEDKNEEENGKNEEENEIEVDDGENDGENNGENEEVDGENEEEEDKNEEENGKNEEEDGENEEEDVKIEESKKEENDEVKRKQPFLKVDNNNNIKADPKKPSVRKSQINSEHKILHALNAQKQLETMRAKSGTFNSSKVHVITSPRDEHSSGPSNLSRLLRKKENNKSKNNLDFVNINLNELSAIRLADIKRNSLSSSSILEVTVVKGKDIHPTKSGQPTNPLCLLAIRRVGNKEHEKKIEIKKSNIKTTKTITKSLNPIWNETHELKINSVDDTQQFLVIEVKDKNKKGSDLGYCEINLNNISDLVEREEWQTLNKRKKKDRVSGSILVKTLIRPEKKIEEAIVIKNENFPTIPSFIYNSFWNRHCVKQLSITYCNITTVPEKLYVLSSLEVCCLNNNKLTTLPKSMGKIYSLKCLDVSNNKIKSLPDELANLRQLQLLNIGNNSFPDEPVPNCLVEIDMFSFIEGKLENWDELIQQEQLSREENEENNDDDEKIKEKQKEIEALLANMK